MNSREHVLEHLAAEMRVADLTAAQALASLTPAMRQLMTQEDQNFFRRHADEPCHEVARACKAGHVWHGDENRN
jgi:ABC-type Fe3+-citrate transport system substrate-binding protein